MTTRLKPALAISVVTAVFGMAVLLATGGAGAADLSPDQKNAVCGTRTTCKVAAVTDAGQDAAGAPLSVVEVRFALADKPEDAPDEGCINDSGTDNEPDHDGGHEFWLLSGKAAPKRLLALCNDGYGSAGVGEDDIEIGPNTITYNQVGGSAWRWTVTQKIRLSPLQVVHEQDCTFNVVGAGSAQVVDVDRTKLQARAVGYISDHPKAAGGGDDDTDESIDCPDWPNGPDSTLPTGPDLAGAYSIPMPNVAPEDGGDPAPLPDSAALGDCALELSSDGLHGFLVFGKAAATDKAATVRVVKETNSSLLVQVHDPEAAQELAAGKAKSWVGQPHIEIWSSEPAESGADDDQAPADADQAQQMLFHQFAVGLDDKVYPGVGKPKQLPKVSHWAAKDEAGRDVTVYRLKWEQDEGPVYGLGVVYSQAEGGKQARLVSNAQIKKNKPLYLPEVWMNTQDAGIPSGSCAVDAKKVLMVSRQ
jgi:hypothetical protein